MFAQQHIPVQLLGPEKGLSQSSVLTIHQDSLGFIWVGTRDGLNTYDGNRVKIYRHVLGDTCSIAGNHINDIANGGGGNLWIAHNNGVSLFDRKKGIFRNYRMGGSSDHEIRSLSVIDGRVWASGWSGVYLYDEQSDLFSRPDIPDFESDVFGFSVSRIVTSPRKNEYWIATATRGFFRYDVSGNRVTRSSLSSGAAVSLHKDERIEDILFHPNGKAYLATYYSGLYECDLTGKPLRHWSSSERASGYSPFDNVRSLALAPDGNIWIGSFQGVGRLDPNTGTVSEINLLNGFDKVENTSIRSLLFDKNGSLWIGTYHDGLYLYDSYLSRFQAHHIAAGGTHIVSAFADKNGSLLAGTESGYLLEYGDEGTSPKRTELKDARGNPIVIKSLYYDGESDVLWIGTLRNGLYKMKNGRVVSAGLETLGVINGIQKASRDCLWLLSDRENGLNRYHTVDGRMTAFPIRDKLYAVIGRSKCRHLLPVDSVNYLLSTTGSGVIAFENSPRGKVEKVLPDIRQVNHTLLLNDTFYVSTNGNGLLLLDREMKVIRHFTEKEGLQNNTVLATLSFDKGVWANCINGISQLTADGGCINYHLRNGFPLSEINEGAYLRTSRAASPFVIGGKDAWVSFHPKNVYKNLYKPSVYLSDVKINNTPIASLPDFSSIDMFEPKEMRLKYDQTTVTFEFAGLNYLMPENNSYKFRLDGFDDDWRYTGREGRAEYGKIPAGRYTLRVHAGNNDGVWSDPLTVPVVVLPPRWLSGEAIVLYIVLFIAAVWFVVGNALRRAELKHNIRLKELERQQIEQMHNMKVKYFTDISHEIRTPLMLILSPVEELLEESSLNPDDRGKVSTIRYYGRRLLQLVNQLLDINRIELGKEHPDETPVMLKNFLENVDAAFQSVAVKNGVIWKTDLSVTTDKPLWIDKDKIEKVLLNLLSNAFKYTPRGGCVSLRVQTSPEDKEHCSLLIEVSDTGSGISPEELPHIFDRFFKGKKAHSAGSGIGLSLVKRIVEDLMKGEIGVRSTLGEGSTFTVTLQGIRLSEYLPCTMSEDFVLPVEVLSELEKEEDEVVLVETSNKKRYNVLLVEDHVTLLNILSRKLSRSFNVFNVVSAEEAIEILKETDIDVVVSDIMLPGKTGKELCAEIKSNILTSHIAVILLTAVQQQEIKMESLEQGADGYLTKPFAYKELQLRIHNILRRQEHLHELYKRDALPEKGENRLNPYDQELMRRIDEQIEKNLSNEMYSIEHLSEDVGLSRVHLYRKVKKLLGVSPSVYLRDYRLRKAAAILSVEEIRVNELAYRVGFQDANYFLKCFKEKFGISPKKYSSPPASFPEEKRKGGG
ncbi:MAG: ATP-binding protein [Tannerella sp.]|nr:ATP-binding protein [Tannerella sp.]